MSDGSLVFDTKIDTSGVDRGVARLKVNLGKATDNVKTQAAAVQGLETEYQRWADTINDVRMAGRQVSPELQSGFDAVSAKLDTARIKLEDLKIKEREAGVELKRAMTPAAGAVDSVSAAVNRFSKRLSNTLKSALVFTVLYKGLSVFRAYMGNALKTNQQFSKSLAQLKGAMLTAFQPVFEVIVPALVTLLQVLTSVISAIARFFALLGGKGLAATTKSAEAMYDEANAVSGAGGAAEDASKSMADFDEINQLSENSASGGGGAGSAGTPASFEGLDEAADKFRLIQDLVLSIAAGLLTWKIASIFTKSLGKIWGLAMSVAGAVLLVKGYIDAWKNGIDWDNLIEIIGGIALVAGGLALAFGGTAAAIALIIGGIALLVLGVREWITTGELSTQTFWALEAGIIAVGIALAILIGWPALVVAAIAAAALAIYKYWDEIKAFFIQLWEDIKEIFAQALDFVKNLWNTVADWFKTKVIDPIVNAFSTVKEKVSGFFKGLWDGIKQIWTTVSNWFQDNVTGPLSKAWSAAISGMQDIFRSVFNTIASIFEGIVNGIISGINVIIRGVDAVVGVVGSVFGQDWNVSTISPISIPRLAQGAVIPPNREFLAMLGDQRHGTNIEAPLDTIVAAFNQALSQNGGRGDTTVILQIDKTEFARAVYKANNSETQRVGLRLAGAV